MTNWQARICIPTLAIIYLQIICLHCIIQDVEYSPPQDLD
jgi:hypothetical protein